MPVSNRYTFTLYNNTLTTIEGQLAYIESAIEEEQFQGAHTLTIRVPVYDSQKLALHSYNSELISPFGTLNFKEKKYIRVVDTIANVTKTYLIQRIVTERDKDKLTYTLFCEPRRMKMLAEIVRVNGPYSSLTATQVVTLLVANSTSFSLGFIDSGLTSIYRNFDFRYPTMLEALQQLCQSVSSTSVIYYWAVNDSGAIYIIADSSYGATHTQPIAYRSNLLGLSRDSDGTAIANQVFGVGNDGLLDLRCLSPTPWWSAIKNITVGPPKQYIDAVGGTATEAMSQVNEDELD